MCYNSIYLKMIKKKLSKRWQKLMCFIFHYYYSALFSVTTLTNESYLILLMDMDFIWNSKCIRKMIIYSKIVADDLIKYMYVPENIVNVFVYFKLKFLSFCFELKYQIIYIQFWEFRCR